MNSQVPCPGEAGGCDISTVFTSYQECFSFTQYFFGCCPHHSPCVPPFPTVNAVLTSQFYSTVISTLTSSPGTSPMFLDFKSQPFSHTSSSLALQLWSTCAMRCPHILKLALNSSYSTAVGFSWVWTYASTQCHVTSRIGPAGILWHMNKF